MADIDVQLNESEKRVHEMAVTWQKGLDGKKVTVAELEAKFIDDKKEFERVKVEMADKKKVVEQTEASLAKERDYLKYAHLEVACYDMEKRKWAGYHDFKRAFQKGNVGEMDMAVETVKKAIRGCHDLVSEWRG